MNLFVFFGAETGSSIRQLDVQLLGTFNNELASLGADSMSNLSTEVLVLHEQEVEFLCVVNQDLLVTIWQDMSSVFCVAESDAGHDTLTFESSSDTVVDSFRASPGSSDTNVAVALMSLKFARTFFDELNLLSSNKDHGWERFELD